MSAAKPITLPSEIIIIVRFVYCTSEQSAHLLHGTLNELALRCLLPNQSLPSEIIMCVLYTVLYSLML